MSERPSAVQPRYGPSLPELLRPHVARLPRVWQRALAALALVAVGVIVWAIVAGSGDDRVHVVVHEPITFNFFHSGGLQEVKPRAGEILRLQTPASASTPQSFIVRPLRLPNYPGDVNAYLALRAATLIQEMRRSIPGFIWRGDGRVAINKQPGHQISFQALIGGRKAYGRRVLLVAGPNPPPHEGVDILMVVAGSAIVPSVDFVGANGQLKSPYRTFRFGTKTSN